MDFWYAFNTEMQLKFSDKMDKTLGKIGLDYNLTRIYTFHTTGFKLFFMFPYGSTFSHIVSKYISTMTNNSPFSRKSSSVYPITEITTTIPDDSETETEVGFEILEAFISSSPRRQFFVKFQKFPIHTKISTKNRKIL